MLYKFKKFRGFTLLELLMVIILLGILVAIGIPFYTRAIEGSRNREAESQLSLIAEAEAMRKLERRTYSGCTGASQCNSNLHLHIPTGDTWHHNVTLPAGGGFNATATRQGADNRVFYMTNSTSEPRCSGGQYCGY